MKLTLKSTLSATGLLVGGFLGASALMVMAAGWSGAPACSSANMPCNNVAAPINVSDAAQVKTGLLSLGNFQFAPGGAAVPADSVLMNAGPDGTVKWGKVSGSLTSMLCDQSGLVSGLVRDTAKTVTFPQAFPTGVIPNVVVTPDVSVTSGSTAPQSRVWQVTNTGFIVGSQQDTSLQWFAHNPACTGVSSGSASLSIRSGSASGIMNTPITVTFSSPMPSTNYAVNTNIVGATVPARGGLNTFITNKTTSGFTYVLTEAFNCGYANDGSVDWVAIPYQ